MIRLIIFTLTLSAILVLAYLNQDVKISITFLGGIHSHPVSVYFLVIGSFLIGTLLSVFMTLPGWIKSKLERRRLEKKIERLEEDLGRIRSEALSRSGPLPSLRRMEPNNLHDDLLEEID